MKKVLLIAIALCLGLAGTAFAAQTSTTLDISVNVGASCTVTAPPMVFPDFVGTDNQISHDITVNCTAGVPYEVTADMGTCGSFYGFPPFAIRCLDDGLLLGNILNYELYTEPGYIDALGDYGLTKDGVGIGGFGTGADDPVTIFGWIMGQPLPANGTYSDTVSIIVIY